MPTSPIESFLLPLECTIFETTLSPTEYAPQKLQLHALPVDLTHRHVHTTAERWEVHTRSLAENTCTRIG
eukprot:COSAG02_NODE_12384_length_1555_cov_2.844780_3_plen_70_part_00